MDDLELPDTPTSGRIGMVLGAGGGAGGMWIRGVLDGLAETTGFRPEHADVLVGTSLGASAAAGLGPFTPPSRSVVDALRLTRAPLPDPSPISRGLAGVRRLGGKAVAVASREGEPDPLTWVEHIEPATRAQVCSMQRFPPARRVATIATSADPVREIAASAAIPFGAQRVEIDGSSHIDGAVWSVTNADLVAPDELDVLVVIAPLVTLNGGTIVSALGRHQLADELRPWHRAGKPALVFSPTADQYKNRQERKQHRADGNAMAISAAGWRDGQR